LSYTASETIKRTAFKHHCDWCDEEIPRGSSCTSYSGADGGWRYRTWRHPECAEASLNVDACDLECCSAGTFRRGTDEQR